MARHHQSIQESPSLGLGIEFQISSRAARQIGFFKWETFNLKGRELSEVKFWEKLMLHTMGKWSERVEDWSTWTQIPDGS